MENNNHQSHQLLHSYCFNPDVRLEAQIENEHIILVVRAHPITQLPWVFNSIVFFIFLLIINIFTSGFFSIGQTIFINIFGTVVILSYIWFNFLSWFFNVGVVTNIRIIDIDFVSIIYKEITKALLIKVEDITSKSGGYFQSFFDYGDVFVQTAGTEKNIEFINISKPSDVVRIISDLVRK